LEWRGDLGLEVVAVIVRKSTDSDNHLDNIRVSASSAGLGYR
jgi:hypothetical protein